ncbi:MAG: HAD hydrolase-like protein [Sediminicola sp.]
MIKNILWDFDGVILDSMAIRDSGFREIFKGFSDKDVDALVEYHRINGGLSRYVKIRYFFESILKRQITKTEVLKYASQFSDIMREELINPKNLIEDAVLFIKENYSNFNFHIVSGSDHDELNFLCRELGLVNYFLSIDGSPTPKNTLVKSLLEKQKYQLDKTCLIGDSFNDYEAAKLNGVSFYGYNNPSLIDKGNYIYNFNNVGF